MKVFYMKKLNQAQKEEVQQIFREMLCEYEKDLNSWCFKTGIEGISNRYEAYLEFINGRLGSGEHGDDIESSDETK